MDHRTNQIIALLGGPTCVARRLGIRPPSVVAWRVAGIPRARLRDLAVDIERASADAEKRADAGLDKPLRRWDLFPLDWAQQWPELIGAEGAPAIPAPPRQEAA